MMGPVQENETSTKVKAIKNIPKKLLVPAFDSDLFIHDDGNAISKAPKKKKRKTKNQILHHTKATHTLTGMQTWRLALPA